MVVFFSSRRRHTRFTSEWSSDVCSSDLGEFGGELSVVSGGSLTLCRGELDFTSIGVHPESSGASEE